MCRRLAPAKPLRRLGSESLIPETRFDTGARVAPSCHAARMNRQATESVSSLFSGQQAGCRVPSKGTWRFGEAFITFITPDLRPAGRWRTFSFMVSTRTSDSLAHFINAKRLDGLRSEVIVEAKRLNRLCVVKATRYSGAKCTWSALGAMRSPRPAAARAKPPFVRGRSAVPHASPLGPSIFSNLQQEDAMRQVGRIPPAGEPLGSNQRQDIPHLLPQVHDHQRKAA